MSRPCEWDGCEANTNIAYTNGTNTIDLCKECYTDFYQHFGYARVELNVVK